MCSDIRQKEAVARHEAGGKGKTQLMMMGLGLAAESVLYSIGSLMYGRFLYDLSSLLERLF